MSNEWEGPSWADAPIGYDPDRDRPWSRARIRRPRVGWRWLVRLRRKTALLCVRIADKLQPDDLEDPRGRA